MPRINRAIELLESGQPIYYGSPSKINYEGGLAASKTWVDYLLIDMEHSLFDLPNLKAFMAGLIDAGPAPSGHLTPSVVVTLPTNGTNEAVIRANAWMIKQFLSLGIHGILLCHAETPGAVKAFVESVRFPFQNIGLGQKLGTGQRGSGGQSFASKLWGLTENEYLQKADVWPLNPTGEIMLGLKIENQIALANVNESLGIPGIAFAEWGPGDMGMSFGYLDKHDPPYPPEMMKARAKVLNACKDNNIAFLNGAGPEDINEIIDEGVSVISCTKETAEKGKLYTNRKTL